MPCTYHEDGMHQTLITSQTLNPLGGGKVEHTCVCWLPQPPARPGKMWVDADDWNALDKWRWNDNATIMRLIED